MKVSGKKHKQKKSHKKLFIFLGILFLFILAAVALLYVDTHYKIRNVYVDGNVHYTDEEIMDIVLDGPMGDNSLYLSIKYKNKGMDDIPFVQMMDVEILAADTIRITVYEKALAGYVEYLGNYMYFDKDGNIVETSSNKTAGIPQVTGLAFDYVVMYEPLPVEDPAIFEAILDITQLLNKYSLAADRLYFGSGGELTIYFQDVKVAVGTGEYMDEKVMLLQSIMPDLEGKSGILHLESYTEETKNVSFTPD